MALSVHSAFSAGIGAGYSWRIRCTQRCSLALAPTVVGKFFLCICGLRARSTHVAACSSCVLDARHMFVLVTLFGIQDGTHSVHSAHFAGTGADWLAHAMFGAVRWHWRIGRTQCTQRCSLALAYVWSGAFSAFSVVRWHWRTFGSAQSVHSALFAGTGAHLVWRTQCSQRCSLALAQN